MVLPRATPGGSSLPAEPEQLGALQALSKHTSAVECRDELMCVCYWHRLLMSLPPFIPFEAHTLGFSPRDKPCVSPPPVRSSRWGFFKNILVVLESGLVTAHNPPC